MMYGMGFVALLGWIMVLLARWDASERERELKRTIYRVELDLQRSLELHRRRSRETLEDVRNPELAMKIMHAIEEGERLAASTDTYLERMAGRLGLDHQAEKAAQCAAPEGRFTRSGWAQA